MSADNKVIVQRSYDEIWKKGNLGTIPEFYATHVVDHNPLPGQAPGLAGLRESFAMILGAFPDIRIDVDLLFAEDDLVVGRWTATGTHQGPMMGIPASCQPIKITGIDVQRIADGKIVEVWHQEDVLGMLQQIGALPEPPPTR
jgi:steroid delta-isomerase-like uncharacterized protein